LETELIFTRSHSEQLGFETAMQNRELRRLQIIRGTVRTLGMKQLLQTELFITRNNPERLGFETAMWHQELRRLQLILGNGKIRDIRING